MRRRRKNDEENQPETVNNATEFNDFSAADESADDGLLQPRPIARQRHRIVTEYEEQVPADEIGTRPQHIVVTPEPATIETELPPHIAAFLEMAGGSSDRWQLKVWRLPRYEIDARTNMQNRMFCGLLDLAPNYEEEIQRRWARAGSSNYFYAMVVKNGLFVKDGVLPVISCEPFPGSEAPAPAQPAAPGYPFPPPYLVETESAPAAPAPSMRQQFKEFFEMQKMFREAFGPDQAPPRAQNAPPEDDEAALLRVLAKDTDIVERVAKGTLGKLLGDRSQEDSNPWADVAMEAIKNGQAANLLQAGINALFNGFRSMVPQPQPVVVPPAGAQPAAPMPEAPPPPQMEPAHLSPEDQVIQLAVNHCLQNRPPQVAAARIIAIADRLNDEAPQFSIDEYLKMFAAMPAADAIGLAAQLAPNGHELQPLPYAPAWVAELQRLIGEAIEGGPDEDQ